MVETEQGAPNIVHRIPKNAYAVSLGSLEMPALATEGFFVSGPIRMVGHMVERFRVGHQSEDAARGVADAGDVLQRSIRVGRPLTVRRVSRGIGILSHHLLVLEEALHILVQSVEVALSVSDRKLDLSNASCKNARRIGI